MKSIPKIIFLISFLIGTFIAIAQNEKAFYRFPTESDSLLIAKNGHLFDSYPTESNTNNYFELAESFWRVKKNNKAQLMFERIEQSKIDKYQKTYLNGSDVENDTIQNTYGYGSFTFNYKNKSSLYLTQILIEKKEFEEALKYLELADKSYKVEYHCGTGSGNYLSRLQELYALCYEGRNQNDKVIELLMPSVFRYRNNCEIIGRALKSKYSKEELKKIKVDAIESIKFTIDNHKSNSYVSIDDGPEKKNTFISGEGFITMLGKTYKLPTPILEDGETVTKQHFINEFKRSRFYKEVFEFWEIRIGNG